MLKLLAVVAVLGLSRGDVVNIKFPPNNPCVLVDIDAAFNLVWINSEGQQQQIPSFTLADASVLAGACSSQSVPSIVMRWADGETFTFSFTNSSNLVSYDWVMRYSPKDIFTNNDQTSTVTHSGSLGSGSAGKAFACQHVPVVSNNQTAVGMNIYQLTVTIKSLKAQAYGVNGGQFSDVERCAADGVNTESTLPAGVTTEPVTTVTTAPTTKPANPTTEPSPKPTTEPTTKPEPVTTEPTTKPTTVTTEPTTKPTVPTTVTTEPTTKTSENPTTETTEPTTNPSTQTTGSTAPSTAPTTPAPAPNAHAKQTFDVFADGVQCVLMDGEFLFTLLYPKEDKTNGTVDIGVQEIKSVTGDCNSTETNENMVTVEFYDTWVMDVTISKKGSSVMLGADENTKYYWSQINLKYSYDTTLGGKPLFPDVDPTATAPELNATLNDGTFEASTDGSYSCNSNQKIDLGGGNSLQTWNLQYDAFATSNHTSFSDKDVSECPADSKTSSVVPIAVGAALAGLVVIVLIAYLIGRRRNRKGYESV